MCLLQFDCTMNRHKNNTRIPKPQKEKQNNMKQVYKYSQLHFVDIDAHLLLFSTIQLLFHQKLMTDIHESQIECLKD